MPARVPNPNLSIQAIRGSSPYPFQMVYPLSNCFDPYEITFFPSFVLT